MDAKQVFVPFALTAVGRLSAVLLVAVGTGWGQSIAEEAKLTAGDGSASEQFGKSVSLSGDTALVGVPYDDDNGTDSGSAYVFVRSGTSWAEEAKLTASDGTPDDWFGFSVSLSGDTALVGAGNKSASGVSTGSVYVFVRSGTSWTEQAKLMASDGAAGDRFGLAVSLSGDWALVGSPYDDSDDSLFGVVDPGSAYVFVRSGTSWTEQVKLTASNAASGDYFGRSVSLSGDTALVGAHMDDGDIFPSLNSGSASVFVRSGTIWNEQAKLTASDGISGDQFGYAVSILDDSALVGAHFDDNVNGIDAGSAYAFVRSGTSWTEQAKFTASDNQTGDFFGYAVFLSGDKALVGASNDDSGSAYLFAHSGTSWIEEVHLMPHDGETGDGFGSSVSMSGDTALVGALADDGNGNGIDSGSAYVFAPPLSPSVYCTAGVSALGCQASISSTGQPSATAPSGFSLTASTVEGAKDGLFFFGTNGQQATPWGNSSSFQCVVPPVIRTNLLTGTGTIGLCDGALSLDMNAVWTNQPAKNPGAGAVVQAQLWYRDPFNTANNQKTSLSDAIEFTVAP